MQRRSVLLSSIAAGAVGVATWGGPPASAAGTRCEHARIKTRDGVALFYRDWGSGRPVLFVHSLSLSSAMWSYQEAFLSDHGVRCVSFDRRGHGRSDESAPGCDLNTFADDIGAVMDGLVLDNVVLVGHSVGCGEIIRYLARHGTSRVAKVILLLPRQCADGGKRARPCRVSGARLGYNAFACRIIDSHTQILADADSAHPHRRHSVNTKTAGFYLTRISVAN
jgi:pimeloyl-ACP methyl ester carboxylesterase